MTTNTDGTMRKYNKFFQENWENDMITLVPEYNGQTCDITGETMTEAVGYFVRGATGRVCLVLTVARKEDHILSTLEEIEQWAQSVPSGYLDY